MTNEEGLAQIFKYTDAPWLNKVTGQDPHNDRSVRVIKSWDSRNFVNAAIYIGKLKKPRKKSIVQTIYYYHINGREWIALGEQKEEHQHTSYRRR